MKNFFLLFILLSAQKCDPSAGLPLIKATSQSWAGGVAGTRGTYYHVYLAMQKNEDFQFDSLWVNGKRLTLEIKRTAPGDTLDLFANDYRGIVNPETHIALESPDATFPIKVSAEGVLGYLYKGERKYLAIPSFQKLQSLNYP